MTFAGAKFRKFLPVAAFAMSAEFLMGIADIVISGHVIGEDGLSAISLMQPVFSAVSFISMLVGTGTGMLYSTEMGRFDKRRASEFLTQGLWCALGLGTLLALGFVFFRGAVLDTFGAAPQVRALADEFWRYFIPCAVLEPVAFFLFSMCSADGDMRLCMFAYAAQLVGNCALSVPFAKCFGISGCAVGTVSGHLIALGVLACHFRREGNSLSFVRHFSFADSARIVSCAAGDASVRIFQAALFYVLNLYVIAKFGTEKLPVLAAVTAVLGLSEAFDSVPSAAQPLAAVYIGEKSDRLVRRIMRYATSVSVASGLAATLLLAAVPQSVTWLVGIEDPALAGEAACAVRIVSLGLVGTALLVLFNSFSMMVGHTLFAATISFVASFGAPFALVFPCGALFGETGLWSALGAAPFAAIIVVSAIAMVRFGLRGFPLYLNRARERMTRVYDLVLDTKSICDVAAAIGKYLSVRCEKRKADLTSLLVEEALMTVLDRNAGRRTLAEVTLEISDAPTIILRDDGVIFDLTDSDAMVTSFRMYFVSCLMAAIPMRRNMTTTSFNRNMFRMVMTTV